MQHRFDDAITGITMGITLPGWSLAGWLFGPPADDLPRGRRDRPNHSTTEAKPRSHTQVADREAAARDTALIARLRDGDVIALRELMRLYAPWLANVAMRIVGSADLAQDVVQETFVRIWEIRAQLAMRGSVRAYLYSAVRNRALKTAIHERSQRHIAARIHAEHLTTSERGARNAGESNIAAEEFRRALDSALSELQPRAREVFLLRAEQGMSYAEIAEALSIGVPTVRMQMYRANKHLMRRMAPWITPFEGLLEERD